MERSHAPVEAFYALISNGWRKGWEHQDISNCGFLSDAERVRERTKQIYGGNQFGRTKALVQQVRVALCQSSIISLNNKLRPKLITQLVEYGLYTFSQALDLIKLQPKISDRERSLIALIPYLPEEILPEVLEVLRKSKDVSIRVNGLITVLPFLRTNKKEVVFEIQERISFLLDTQEQASALTSLFPHVSQIDRIGILQRALDSARGIRQKYKQALALINLVPYISKINQQEVVYEVYTIAKEIPKTYERISILSKLIPHLSSSDKQKTLDEALTIVEKITDKRSRLYALVEIAPYLTEEKLYKTLSTIQEYEEIIERAILLCKIIQTMKEVKPESLLTDALMVIRQIEHGSMRSYLLSELLINAKVSNNHSGENKLE